MNIKVEIIRTFNDKGALVASASLIFEDSEDAFIVKNIKVINGSKGLFAAMPNFKGKAGKFIDTCFALNTQTHNKIQQAVLDAYTQASENSGQNDYE